MIDPHPHLGANPVLLVFGPQVLNFDAESFKQLCIRARPHYQWLLETVSTLPDAWNDISKSCPSLNHYNGAEKLKQLREWVLKGEISEDQTLLPSSNIILSPLVVIGQLIQYWEFLIAAFPRLKEDSTEQAIPITGNAETLGLCTGMLSAIAVACSSNLKELQEYGAVAVRLAMLTGAFADAEEELREYGQTARSFSLGLISPGASTALEEALADFPDAYVALLTDEKRVTITTSQETAPGLIQRLKLAGVQATKVSLHGRFHYAKYQKEVDQLIVSCTAVFQFPDVSEMALPSRSNSDGRYISAGKLHEVAIRSILVEQSQWYKTFSEAYSCHFVTGNALCVSFGLERCIPPTLARRLGTRLQAGDSDFLTSGLPGEPLIMHRGDAHVDLSDERIAVIGMACQLPGAENIEDYWNILCNAKSQHREVPRERFTTMDTTWRDADPDRKWFGNFIEDYSTFDHKFFKKSPRETASTDPQQRLMLQIAYQALEQSGYFGNLNDHKHKVGCFLGVGNVDYEDNIACYPATAYSATGNLKSFVAGKISHHFGWTGPSLTIDTACSSSSVAIHYACRSILSGECLSALAGGVNIITSPDWYHNLSGASFLSPTGQCKPFDIASDGYCRGEGVGAVLLKRLSSAIAEGDQILGVLSSTGVSQNGNGTAITVPMSESLSDLFLHVLQKARLKPEDISVIESHGTGTVVGDPAEYQGIQRVFGRTNNPHKVSLTSVKGLIGHTECASGVASLIKVLLMIQERLVPPQASFTSINPRLGLEPRDNIEISTQLKPWDVRFRATLINNYGASGSNASMVVTQPPDLVSQNSVKLPSDRSYPFWFCGNDEKSIRLYIARILKFLKRHNTSEKDLSASNLSFQVSRQSNRSLDWALILDCHSCSDLQDKLSAYLNDERNITAIRTRPSRPVIFCFGGQVSTFVGLDQDIYNSMPLLRGYLDQCNAMSVSMNLGSIYPDIFQKSPIHDIVKLHINLFAIQYSAARSWIDCGIKVAAAIGHSFGELTALCVSNALSLKHAIEMIAGRANLIQRNWNADRGCMMAVDADPADLNALLAEFQEVSIACYNGPRSFTLAGTECAIDLTLMEVTKADTKFSGVRVRKLHVTNAFHCHLVDPLLKDLQQLGRKLSFKAPDFPLEKATERDSTDKHDEKFLAHHLRDPVYFHQAVQRLVKKHPSAIWLEIGSSSTVTTMASRALEHSDASVNHFQAVNITSDGSFNLFTETTSRLWKEGLRVHFWAHHQTQTSSYTPVILPPYQFEKSKHWMDSKTAKPGLNLLDNQNSQQGKGLTTFVGYTDESNRSALFDVNTSTERFTHLVAGHIMAGAAAVCPGIFQMELVLDALMSLRPEFAELSFRPELQGMHHFHPLVPDNTKRVWIEAKSRDPQRLVWDWRILATNAVSSASREHTSGVFSFWDANDSRIQAELEGYERWISSKRCTRLLERRDADDILQGRNVYRAFSQIIDYKEIYRHVNVIVGKDNESAGRVVKNHIRESWLDSILTDCFCQVAGIFVNLMTERSDITKEGIFVCDGIGRWLRSSKMGPDVQLDHWEIFALHHPVSEKKFLSDVFVFNPHNGSLLEVILGISYQWTTADGIRKALCHPDLTGPVHHFFPTKPPTNHNGIFPQALNSAEIEVSKSREKTEREPTIINKQRKMDVASKTREIICNISGLGHDEVKDNSDLIELGIDSLMSMELTREVDATFRCSLEIAQLMDLTDFQSLVTCIQKTLGVNCQTLDNVSETHNTPEEESKGEAVIYESSVRLGSIVQDNALPASIVLEAFRKAADSTDDFIIKGHLDTYHAKIMPRSTELCVVYILDAFEKLGVNLRTAVPGQKIERVPYLHKHAQLMDLVYELLSKNARLIELHNGVMTRTAVATPNKPADVMLEHLLRDEPSHAAEHKLIRLTGERFAECITGKTDGLQIIFGTPEGRQIATDLYAKSPINGIWIDQAEYFLENLVSMLPQGIEPLCILEMGAGTGGTTIKMVQLFARLGIPVKYTVTDLSSSLVAAARKRFKQYNFLEFKVLDIEATPDPSLLHSQHIILATNCVHATRNLSLSTSNIRNILRPDGFLLLIEMTEQVPWVDFIFGLVEGWWLFNDGREHALQPPTHWAKVLCSVGFNSISWTQGKRPEANIQRLIIALADGSRYDIMPNSVFPATRTALTNNAVAQNRQMIIDAYVCEYSKDFLPSPRESSSYRAQKLNKKHCVLVTGTTGSLGSHVVEFLAQIPEVETVVCLNRSSATNVALRQQQSFELRGIFLDTTSLSKLRMLETDASRPMLGLPEHTFQHLVDNVTHIVHNAWPMSLTRQISAYEPQFQVLKNLILLSNMATSQRLVPFKFSFQFISSIGVVGYHPLWTSKTAAPEEPMSVESVLPVGYADAKLVCERILGETLYRYPEHFRSTSVRIAQISGSKSNGYWNSVEHFASLLRSSQTLNILPDLTGTLSWCPVQDVAATLGELLILNKNRPYQIYHIENPSRQRWSEMIRKLADTIGIPHYCIIPFDEWISRVSNSSSRACDNPARQLVGFFEKHFIRMSCGGLVLDTVNTWEHSKSFRSIKPVDKELVTKYIASWKTLGFLC